MRSGPPLGHGPWETCACSRCKKGVELAAEMAVITAVPQIDRAL
ncbi:hypothetical protein ANO11243_024330 [Dothideomycetidae sp. 11243]|nr:hypothetical protein ANO11243_024330 [fungal sp. No.11243]